MLDTAFGEAPRESAWPGEWSSLLAMPPISVLIVEDDATIRSILMEVLSAEGFQATAVPQGREARHAFKQAPAQVLLTDFKLPDTDGLVLLEEFMQQAPATIGVVMTGYGTVELAVKAMKVGAFDILLKPFEPDQVLAVLGRIQEMQRLRHENGVLKRAVLRGAGLRVQQFRMEPLHQNHPASVAGAGIQESKPAASSDTAVAYQRGLQEGERRASANMGAGLDRERALLASAIREFERARAAAQEQCSEQVTALALAIASKVVRDHVDQHRDLVVSQVKDALTRIPASQAILIRVHPDDLNRIEAARSTFSQLFEIPVTLKIDGDPAIAPGGCKIETPTRFVDATLDAQLARVGEGLKRRGKHAG
jgi:flagellar biosynthesis/type III secretory pathway protein FliH/ActR/RegA family two-component response regulator